MSDHGYHSLGKYSSARDDILHFMCTSDWAEDSFGNVEAPTGYVWKISNAPGDVNLHNTEVNSLLEEWFVQNPEVKDSSDLRFELVGHFLVQATEQGFINVIAYDDKQERDNQFLELSNHYDRWDTDEDED